MPIPTKLSPRTLFAIDGVGALFSAFLLGVVLIQFEETFGMPRKALYVLATLPVGFALYDLFCYRFLKRNPKPFLRAIAIANLLYCCLSIGFVVHHFSQLTIWGLLYFGSELLIVLVLAVIELKVASR
jgi:hypothetical protein